ncbi:MAG: hypothetical protein U0166_05580 [Acidobacteriota bacterium]
MPQLHLYVPADVAKEVARRAKAQKKSVSRFLADVVKRALRAPPAGHSHARFIGAWKGEPLVRPPQGEWEERDELL